MPGLTQRVLKGSTWVFGLKFAEKVMRAVQLVVVAHFLVPKDFGLFGAAFLALGALEIFTRTGCNDAIIHKRGNIEPYLHTGYWIQVLRGLLLASIIYLSAPFLAVFFKDPAVIPVVRVLALTQVIYGFRSIGIICLQRELKFKSESIYLFVGGLISLVSIITLAYIFRNVWALVIGAIIGETALTILSFLFHPYRPRLFFSLQKAKEFFDFGIWLLFAAIASYIAMQADKLFVGRLMDLETLGIYQMAFSLALLPTTHLIKISGKILKPAYAELQNEKHRLTTAFGNSFTAISALLFPAVFGLILIAPIMVPVVLGRHWSGVIPLLSILALSRLFGGFALAGSPLFVATGNTRFIFRIESLTALVLLVGLYPCFVLGGPAGIAWAFAISTLVQMTATLWHVRVLLDSSFSPLKRALPAIFATITMVAVTLTARNLLPAGWLGLICLILIGVFTYIPTILLLLKISQGLSVKAVITRCAQ